MADPLGTVASILQLVDTALKIRDHIQDFRHAPQEQQELLKEMDYLRNLLDHIHTYIARNPSDATLKRMESPLTTFKLMMMQVTEKLRLGGGLFSKFSKRMKWTMGDKQAAEEYLKKFDQFKLLLNSWLVIHLGEIGQKNHQDSNEHLVHIEQQHQRENNDLLRSLDDVAKTLNSGVTNIINGISEQQTQSNSMARSVDDVAAVVNTGVTKIANSISEQQQQMGCAERTRIIDWLSPINFFLRHADVARTQQAGTGRWLLAEPRFQDWKASAGRTLWCPGIPGAGKTVLTSMVVDHFAAAECENNTIGVACVYLNHKEADNHTPSRLLAGLWRQLVLDRDIGSLAAKLYSQHQEKRTFPSLEEVVDVLRSSLDVFSRVYVIVDALDECPEAQRWIFLRHLAALGPTVNLMITSRPHITPEASHRNLDILEIRAIDEDVRTYADARIEHSPRLSKHVQAVPELRLEILSKIVDGVDGMFLLAKLHLDSVGMKPSVRAVREALKQLPKNLNDTYETALKRIEDQGEEDRKIAHSTLTWVVNAKRPLTVPEIRIALAIDPIARRLDEENLIDIEIILGACAGLVILDEQLSIVRLVHYTTQEYLDNIQAGRFPQTDIARTLFTFLALDYEVSAASRPLLDYSQYCLAHAAGQPEQELNAMIVEFLGRAAECKERMGWQWMSQPWDYPHWPIQPSPLWIATASNLLHTAKFFLGQEQLPMQSKCAVLSVASYYGHLPMVQLLLKNGARASTKDRAYGSVLQAAVYSRSRDVIRLLLDNGAELNKGHGEYGTALVTASRLGDENIARLLLEKGADPNVHGSDRLGQSNSALSVAVTERNENMASLLIENGADVNERVEDGTLLIKVSYLGHENLVRLLIDNGADLNARGRYGTPLEVASFHGHESIVRLLLGNGADPNACRRRCNPRSALRATCVNGSLGTEVPAASLHRHKGFAPLPLANQDEDEYAARGTRHVSALHAALSSGEATIARLLIESGAAVNLRIESIGSLLTAVSYAGQESLVRLLIENGADINAQGGLFGTALAAASFAGHTDVVHLLLANKAGAYVSSENKENGSMAMEAASLRGHESIVQLLLQYGATPLEAHSARQRGSRRVTENTVHKFCEAVLAAWC